MRIIQDTKRRALGKTEKSGRDGFVVYMGNDIFGVKWRNWKLHFKEQDSAFDELRTYTIGIKKFRLVRVFENHKNLTDVNNHKTMKGGKKGKRL